MEKHCRTCMYSLPQVFREETTGVHLCAHISFFRSGLFKPDAKGNLKNIYNNTKEKIPIEQSDKAFKDRFFYADFVDIKPTNERLCTHWRSVLAIADQILDQYKDEDFKLPYFEKEMRTYPKLHRIHRYTFDTMEVIDVENKDYNPCSTCRYFKYAIAEDGACVPFKGFCTKDQQSTGVFSLVTQSVDQPTYTFNTCPSYSDHVKFKRVNLIPLSNKLLIFVECNPMDLTLADFNQLARYPSILKKPYLTDESFQGLLGEDLDSNLKKMFKSYDRNKLQTLFSLKPIKQYFTKALKRGSEASRNFWNGQFDRYKESDNLFKKNDK